jgi:hypothetical protein
MATIGLGILYTVTFWAYLSLAQNLFNAGRRIRRHLWPTFSERVDKRMRDYVKHPLTLAEAERAFNIPANSGFLSAPIHGPAKKPLP